MSGTTSSSTMEMAVEVRLGATGEAMRFERVTGLCDLLGRVRRASIIPIPISTNLRLVFETATVPCERALVDSDLALRVAANAHGTLYAEHYEDAHTSTTSTTADTTTTNLVSVSACLRNVVAAALNKSPTSTSISTGSTANIVTATPPSPPLVACLFNNNNSNSNSSNNPSTSTCNTTTTTTAVVPPSRANSSPPSPNASMSTPPPLSPPTSRSRSPLLHMGTTTSTTSMAGGAITNSGSNVASSSGMTAEVRCAEHYFCTHRGVECVSCSTRPICGTRYKLLLPPSDTTSTTTSYCSGCIRRARVSWSYMVYDHPWESCEEYEEMVELRAAPAPLYYGDMGPKVTHLHFTLYTLGYLFLLAPGFVADTFNNVTADAIQRLHSDNSNTSNSNNSYYSNRTRSLILNSLQAIHRNNNNRNNSNNRSCSPSWRAQAEARLRLKSAIAA